MPEEPEPPPFRQVLTTDTTVEALAQVMAQNPRGLICPRDEIVGWAELRGFVGAELRTLSTGMQTRLAFAIAMHITSDLILMDEAFSAGDKHFQDRCDLFFQEAKHKRRTVLVATHNLRFVNEFCDRTLWLEKGKQIAFGPTRGVLTDYVECVSGHGAQSFEDVHLV